MVREQKLREEMEVASTEAKLAQQEAVAKVTAKVNELRKRVRAAEKEREEADSRASKLGRQVCIAHVEQAKAIEREEIVRREAANAAMEAAHMQADAVAKASEELRAMRTQVRLAEKEKDVMKGRLERLGCQLGVALVDAARTAECARGLKTANEELRRRMTEQEEVFRTKIDHLRTLKAQMAKRALAMRTRELAQQTH